MQKIRLGRFILALLALCILVACLIKFVKPPREKYQEFDFESGLIPEREFYAAYKEAIALNTDWVKNPEMVALRVAGYPNIDKIDPEKVEMETNADGITIVVVLSPRLMDDSIRRQETRVELIKDGDIWKIVWAGWRQQCARGLFNFGWTTSLCP